MWNKCRICLVDGAKLPIFESVATKESVHSKLFQCFKEKIEDIEGYPRNICVLCNDTLNTVCNFITKFKISRKLLESGLIAVKNEIHSDNESLDNDADLWFKDIENDIHKNEPYSDSLESLYESENLQVHLANQDQCNNLNEIKKKLKSLKEINFKKKPARKPVRKTGKVPKILKVKLARNGESSKSNKLAEPKEGELQGKFQKQNLLKPVTDPQPPIQKLCDICGQVFKDIELHRKDKHLVKPTKCPQCPNSSRYYSPSNLKRHTKIVHSNKEYFCDICGKGFSYKGRMTSHIKQAHLNAKIKRIICHMCNKAFFTGKSLLIHQRSVHTGLRPAQCSVCEASFYHEDYLKEHMRLHTGETPFKCPLCGRGYAQRGNMKSHIAHNHRLVDLSEEQIKNLKPSWFKYLKKP